MIQQGAKINNVGERKENHWRDVLEQVKADGIQCLCRGEGVSLQQEHDKFTYGNEKAKYEGVVAAWWV